MGHEQDWRDLKQAAPFTTEAVLRGRILREAVSIVNESVSQRYLATDRSDSTKAEGEGVLLLSPSPIDARMMGPGIRYWEFARAISRVARVTLVVPNETMLTHPDFAIHVHKSGENDQALLDLVTQHQIVVIQGFGFVLHPGLARHIIDHNKYLVVDLYGPFGLEGLETRADNMNEGAIGANLREWAALNEQIKLADFFVCSSERQRDYWLGMLSACYRLNPHTYADDHTARRLIGLVPFGLPDELPVHHHTVLKGVHSHVAPTDKVILWAGGIWDWMDPLSLLRALANLVAERQDIKLLFLSGRQAADPASATMSEQAVRLSQELGLYNQYVFFERWVPYEERANYFLEADVGVCFHFDHLETRFAFRTRILDYIWAGLPIITGSGDTMGDLVKQHGLGYAIPPGDVAGLTNAMRSLLNEPDSRGSRREAFARLAHDLSWERTTASLRAYCQAPWRAPDKLVSIYDQWTATALECSLVRAATAYERAEYFQRLAERLMSGCIMRLLVGAERTWRRLWNKNSG